MKIVKCNVSSCRYNNSGSCINKKPEFSVEEISLLNRYNKEYFVPVLKCNSFIINQ